MKFFKSTLMRIPSRFTKDQAIDDCSSFSSSPILNEFEPENYCIHYQWIFYGDCQCLQCCQYMQLLTSDLDISVH